MSKEFGKISTWNWNNYLKLLYCKKIHPYHIISYHIITNWHISCELVHQGVDESSGLKHSMNVLKKLLCHKYQNWKKCDKIISIHRIFHSQATITGSMAVEVSLSHISGPMFTNPSPCIITLDVNRCMHENFPWLDYRESSTFAIFLKYVVV